MKHVTLFEDFDNEYAKEIRDESQGSWADVRNTIQKLEPFTIVNFKNGEGYSKFIDDTSYPYIKQEYRFFANGKEEIFPSLFFKGKKNITDDDFKKYSIRSVVAGDKDKKDITYRTLKTKETIGNELQSSLSIDDMKGEDFYTTGSGSQYYRFLNFY